MHVFQLVHKREVSVFIIKCDKSYTACSSLGKRSSLGELLSWSTTTISLLKGVLRRLSQCAHHRDLENSDHRIDSQNDVLMLKFNHQEFKDTVQLGSVRVKIEGMCEDGMQFEAYDSTGRLIPDREEKSPTIDMTGQGEASRACGLPHSMALPAPPPPGVETCHSTDMFRR